MRPVVVIGYSGHAYVACDAILSAGRKIAGYCDIAEKDQNPFRLPFIGYELDEDSLEVLRANDYFIAIGDNARRQAATEALLAKGLGEPTSVVHARAVVGYGVTVGSGSLVAPGSVINALSAIGNGVVCNTHSVIEHECVVGDYAHVGPSATLAGNVHIGDGAFIGANSVIREGVRIGSNSTVGAGSVVLRDVPDDVVVVGNPARILPRRDNT